MSRAMAVLRQAVLVGVCLAGHDVRAVSRGVGPLRTFVVVCKHCATVVAESRETRPSSIYVTCSCGRTTPSNWLSSTETLKGTPCKSCGIHLYYRIPFRGDAVCHGGELHEPAPLHQRDWR
jgi:hypothetical protein